MKKTASMIEKAGVVFAAMLMVCSAAAEEFVLENDFVRIRATDTLGGKITEVLNKKTGTNHVAAGSGEWGWSEYSKDTPTDKDENASWNQVYRVEKVQEENGGQTLFFTGRTAEQEFQRTVTISKDSPEILIRTSVKNISDHPRALQVRWHPYILPSKNPASLTGCFLLAGDGNTVRKIRLATGFDNWFESSENPFGAVADYATGDGLFFTYNREEVPLLMTWTQYKRNSPYPAAVTVESFAQPLIMPPGAALSASFSYYPFDASTDFSKISCGVIKDPAVQKRMKQFVRNALPKDRLALFGGYTLARSEFYDWQHRRRDVFGLSENYFADCAMIVHPDQDTPMKLRFIGGVFQDAPSFAKWNNPLHAVEFQAKISSGEKVYYDNTFRLEIPVGVNAFDRETAVAVNELPDGDYDFQVSALDPFTRHVFFTKKSEVHVFGNKIRQSDMCFPVHMNDTAEAAAEVSPAETAIPIHTDFGMNGRISPVSLGVPLPQGVFFEKTAGFRLTGKSGGEIPADISKMNIWPDGSLKWLCVSFNAVPGEQYVLKIGTSVRRDPAAEKEMVQVKDNELVIDTGFFTGSVDRKSGRIQLLEKGRKAVLPVSAWWSGKDGKYDFAVAGPASGSLVPGVRLESNGTQRAVIRISGWYGNTPDRTPAFGEFRLEFYRGLPYYKIYFNTVYTGTPGKDTLRSSGIVFDPGDGSAGNQGKLVLRDEGKLQPKNWKSEKGKLILEVWPESAPEQTFMPEMEYWIPSSSSSEACATGLSRTMELFADYGSGLDHTDETYAHVPPAWVRKTDALGHFSLPGELEKDVEDFLMYGVDFILLHQEFYQFYGHWNYGTVHNVFQPQMRDWLRAGRYANIGNEQDIARAPWLMYFRSGDRKYRRFAELWTRHLMEVQSIRWHHLYPLAAGMSRRHHRTAWLGNADYGHTMVCPFLEYYHASGYLPAWEFAKMTGEAAKLVKEGRWRYLNNPISNLTRMYLETGDADYKKHADRLWNDLCKGGRNQWYGSDHGTRMAVWYSKINPEMIDEWKKFTKEGIAQDSLYSNMNYVEGLNALYERTGDPWFALTARLAYDVYKTKMLRGNNPLYRGLYGLGNAVQHGMAAVRDTVSGGRAVTEGRKLFPMTFCNLLDTREVRATKTKDEKIILLFGSTGYKKESEILVTALDGEPVKFSVKKIYEPLPGHKNLIPRLFEIVIEPDGKANRTYVMKTYRVLYLGGNLKDLRIVLPPHFTRTPNGGDELYLNCEDFDGSLNICTGTAPGSSLEISSPDGKSIFSYTEVRGAANLVRTFRTVSLPRKGFVRVRDRSGISVENKKELVLYLNPLTEEAAK